MKPLIEFRSSPKVKSGYENVCVECTNRRVRERRAKNRKPRGDVQRKLPPYEVLRQHVVQEGMSLADIGEKYDVTKAGVYATLRRRAMARNDWPLPRKIPAQELAVRGMAARTVNPLLIVGLVFDWLDEHDVALREFCAQHGFSWKYLTECRAGRCSRMDFRYAGRLLVAVGEPVPASLRLRSVKYSGAYPRGRRHVGTEKGWLGQARTDRVRNPVVCESSPECGVRAAG